MSSVNNPATPYVGPIPGGLPDGTEIHVKGTSERHHNGFLVSLQCGGSIDPRSECALAFNPRFNENAVIRNSLQGGSWGAEERHGGFPFQKGGTVDINIHVKSHCYSIAVNGRHYCDYNHRIPKHMVTHIAIEQGIRISHIRFKGAAQPYPGTPGPIFNPPVPFTQHIGGLYPNKMICISGIPHPNPSRITINLQNGTTPPEIAFHFDIRFRFGSDRNVIVRNSLKCGGWGPEERSLPRFPFVPDMFFEVIILVEHGCFKVAVNNQHLLEFNHRLQPLMKYDTLRITGDVRLTQVRLQG